MTVYRRLDITNYKYNIYMNNNYRVNSIFWFFEKKIFNKKVEEIIPTNDCMYKRVYMYTRYQCSNSTNGLKNLLRRMYIWKHHFSVFISYQLHQREWNVVNFITVHRKYYNNLIIYYYFFLKLKKKVSKS